MTDTNTTHGAEAVPTVDTSAEAVMRLADNLPWPPWGAPRMRRAADTLRALLARAQAAEAEVTRLRDALGLQTAAARDVLAERARQISAEGWTPEEDDAYQARDLANAGASYALVAGLSPEHRDIIASTPPGPWPWAGSWWKPTDPRRDLVKAGALILAEIERLDRATLRKGGAA